MYTLYLLYLIYSFIMYKYIYCIVLSNEWHIDWHCVWWQQNEIRSPADNFVVQATENAKSKKK